MPGGGDAGNESGVSGKLAFWVPRFLCKYPLISSFPGIQIPGVVALLFNLGRHLVSAEHYRALRGSAFTEW
jgi:hypothetical protein